MVSIKNTREVTDNGQKFVVFGPPGSGKTRLCSTCPRPIIISAENGLLSLRDFEIPYVEVKTIAEFNEALAALKQPDIWNEFDTICIDSVSELAEIYLKDAKERSSGWTPYTDTSTVIIKMFRELLDLKGKHILMIFKEEAEVNPGVPTKYRASLPGKVLPTQIPFFPDEVFAMRTQWVQDQNGKPYITRFLQTINDGIYVCKDRSGALAPTEDPDISKIIAKIKEGAYGKSS